MKWTIVTIENYFEGGTITFIREYTKNEIIEDLKRKMCFIEKRFKMFGCNFLLSEKELTDDEDFF